jgi:hypothetical protein
VRKDQIRRNIKDFIEEYLEPASAEAAFEFTSIITDRSREVEYERLQIQDEVFETLNDDTALKNMVLQLWAIDRVAGEIPRGLAHYTRDQQKVLRLIRILALMGWELRTDEGITFALNQERKILDRWIMRYEPNNWGELTFAESVGFDQEKVQRIIESSIGSGDGGDDGGNGATGPSGLLPNQSSKPSVDNGASSSFRVGLERVLGIGRLFQPVNLVRGFGLMTNTAGCKA